MTNLLKELSYGECKKDEAVFYEGDIGSKFYIIL